MMKSLLSMVFWLILSIDCSAQNKLLDILPLKDGKVNYTKVVEMEGISKEELFERAKYWLLESSTYQKDIVYPDDKNEEIVSNGFIKALWGPNNYKELSVIINHSIKLKFRYNKYQYEITNFTVKKSGMETQIEIYKMEYKKKYNKMFYNELDKQIKIIITSLEKTMTIDKHFIR